MAFTSTLTQPLPEHLDHVVSYSQKCPSQDWINVGNGWRKQSLRNFTSMISSMNCKIKWQLTQHDTFRARCCWNYTYVGLVESICKDFLSHWRISTYIKQTLQHTTTHMRLLATWSNTSKRWMSNYYLSKNHGDALHCQVEYHVRDKKIYFILKTSPKWVDILSIFFHE
jgi:hypothetical protein